MTNTSIGTTSKIIHDHLHMNKLYAKWIPYSLTEVDKAKRVQLARDFIKRFCTDFDSTKARLITSDETWVLYATPDTKETSREWTPDGLPAPQKSKISPRSEKVMLTVWWDAKGPIFLDFWRKSDKISFDSVFYRDMIIKLRETLPKVRRGMIAAGPLVFIDNAPVHRADICNECFANNGFERIVMPAYSPDLAPSDFYLFRNLKTWLRGRCFDSREEVMGAVTAWFESKPAEFYDRGISQLSDRMKQVIESEGEYLESEQV